MAPCGRAVAKEPPTPFLMRELSIMAKAGMEAKASVCLAELSAAWPCVVSRISCSRSVSEMFLAVLLASSNARSLNNSWPAKQ
eukprot:4193617-Alexandrium_andersonii.AAC.1